MLAFGLILGRLQASITFFRACKRNSKCACKNTSYLDVKAFTTFLDHFIHVDIPFKIVSYMQSQNFRILDNIQCNLIDGNWLKVVNII